MNFSVSVWEYFEENGVFTLAFSSSESKDQYIIIQNSEKYSDQDRELGQDSHHLELNDQSSGIYSGIKNIEIKSHRLNLNLSEMAAKQFNTKIISLNIPENFMKIISIFHEKMKIDLLD